MRDGIHYKCDDCEKTAEFKSYKKARSAGWGLAKNYTDCYCPKHAPIHRRGNAKNTDRKAQASLRRLIKMSL